MLKKSLFTILTLSVFLTVFSKPAFAVSSPDFGSCLNPQVTASQVNGGSNHGVAGQTTTYSGTDSIYYLSDGNVMQCLCPDSGTAIQTNWLKTSNLSASDIDVLKSQGWTYVATGSSWGLSDVPYLAKNSNYSCRGENTTPTVQSSVLSLAYTGSAVAIYGLIIAGVTALVAGMLLKKFSK
ncbi:MAG TPA: hypothetical protein VE090_01215 [Methylomirabilota bacterium]|nr:hypothetical protein [Methylomirabilota bacterium]